MSSGSKASLNAGSVALLRWALASGGASLRKEGDRSLAILKERHARGEVDKSEFEARKRDLA
jgi:uncharacterized membrane protein